MVSLTYEIATALMSYGRVNVTKPSVEKIWGGPSTPPSYSVMDLGQLFSVNTLRPRQHGRHFPDDLYKCIFLNENEWISINISPKFVPKGPIIDIPALVQIMAWRRSGDKPLSEPMMVRLPTHIYVTRPQWVKGLLTGGKCAKEFIIFVTVNNA